MIAQQLQIDVTSNNIANVNTIGYKKGRAEFADLMYQSMQYAGSATSSTTMSPTGMDIGLGVRPTSVQKMFTQGGFKETGNDLDMVISGNGFFQIQMPDGTTAYTRNGSFKLDGNGTVVTSDGYPLMPQMVIPADATKVSIATDGTVSVLQPGQTALQQIGQVETASFINPAGLHALGDNNYINTTASGDAIVGVPGLEGRGGIRQSFVEMSNVQLVEEMTDLITGQRAYEANSKAIFVGCSATVKGVKEDTSNAVDWSKKKVNEAATAIKEKTEN
jgi:flagellar basal-body rod protein FlgG